MREAELQSAVIDLARLMGWIVYHTHDSRRSEPGFPDLVMCRDGHLIFAELKSDHGRLRPEQVRWLHELEAVENMVPRRAGPLAVRVFVWRPSDWDEIQRVLTRR